MLALNHNDEFRRLPGLYRRWELARLLKPGEEYRIEDAGTTLEGTALLAVYERTDCDCDGAAR